MRKMMSGDEEVDKTGFHSTLKDIICNNPTDKVLSRAGPAMEAEYQSFIWVFIVEMSF